MELKPWRVKYFVCLFLSVVTIAPMLGGCARVYYGSFRYDAECIDQDPRHPGKMPVCIVERTK